MNTTRAIVVAGALIGVGLMFTSSQMVTSAETPLVAWQSIGPFVRVCMFERGRKKTNTTAQEFLDKGTQSLPHRVRCTSYEW